MVLRRLSQVALVLTLLIPAKVSLAQEYRATVTGRVVDEQGGVLPGVSVIVTHLDTGTAANTVTDATGIYTIPLLNPGLYSVKAELQGFQRVMREQVALSAGQRVALDLTMKIGNMSEVVTVSGESTLLQTSTASVGLVVDMKQIDSLPLSGRAPSSLIKLSAGVTDQTSPVANTRPFDNSGTSSFSMGGGQTRTNELLLDGQPNMARDRRISYNPPSDVVQEITIDTFQSDAAYGDSAAGTVNIVTRSGTNVLRATANYYWQPSSLTGTTYFTKRSGGKEPPFTYKQGGFTASGPVVIPRLIDGRNRLLWVVSYDNIRDSYVTPVIATVPTEAMRNGDFSQLLALGDAYRIYDPMTGVVEGSRRRRQPFDNNIIQKERLNRTALAYLKFYPLPNLPGEANGTANYLSPTTRSDTYHTVNLRADLNLTARSRLMVKWYGNDRVERKGNLFGNIGTGAILPRLNSGAMADYVHTFKPTLLLNVRFGWTRFDDEEYRQSTGFDISAIGFPPSVAAASLQPVLPLVTFGDSTTSLGPTGGNRSGAGFVEIFDSFQWFFAMTAVKGRQTLKLGGDVRRLRENSIDYGNAAGSYTFGTNWTRGPLDNAAGAPSGQALASFLLGLPTAGSFDVRTSLNQRTSYAAVFFQDDWRPRPSLTLNLGIRYEYETGTSERFDRTLVGFDESAVNSITAAAKAAYAARPLPELPASQFNPAGGPIFASPARQRVFDTPNGSVSPRVGVAFSPGKLANRTVFRGGFGIYYQTYGLVGVEQPGFSQTSTFVATNDGFLTPYATFSNPFPDGILQPVGASRGLDQNIGTALTFTNPKVSQPYARRYTAGVQQLLAKGMVLEVSYMHSELRRLPVTLAVAYTPAGFLSTSPTRDQATINRLTANVPNPFAGLLPGTTLNGSTIPFEQLVRAFPQYTSLSETNVNMGYSDQDMVSLTIQKRFSAGLQVLATYTKSRMLEATSKLNASDTQLNRRVATADRPDRFVLSGVYELPFGDRHRIGAASPEWLRKIIGGWNISGVYTYQTAGVLTWGNVIYLGGDLRWSPRNVDQAFCTTCFNTIASEQLDRNIRTFPPDFGQLRLDPINTVNLAVLKNITVGKGQRLQFRAEMFNALDRVQFPAPVTTPTSANFGKITSQANAPRSVQFALRWMY